MEYFLCASFKDFIDIYLILKTIQEIRLLLSASYR